MEDNMEKITEATMADSLNLLSSNDENKSMLDLPEVSTTRSSSFLQKYGPAMKTLIPIRPFSNTDGHPNDKAGLISTITFSWITALVWKTFRRPPTTDDLWKISKYDEAQVNYERFARLWKKELLERGVDGSSLWRVSLRFIRTRLIISAIVLLVFAAAVFSSSAILMRHLLSYVSQESNSLQFGFMLVGVLFSVEICRAFMLTILFGINYRTAVRTRAAMLMLVFKKVLKLSPVSGNATVGELVTMCSNDGDRIFEACRMGNIFLIGPVIFISGTVYTAHLFGAVGLIGSFIFLSVLPLQGLLVRVMNTLRQRAIIQSEARVKKISEILSSIKLIKMYSWEESFTEIVNKIRKKELDILRQSAFVQSITVSMAYLTPMIASVVLISAFVSLGNNLTPEIAFTCIAVFNAMSVSLKMMPFSIKALADVNVTMTRLKKLLVMPCIQDYVKNEMCNENNVIEIMDASLSWNTRLHIPDDEELKLENSETIESKGLLESKDARAETQPLALKNINFSVEKGSLVGIYGSVGAGKTSLISSILGHLHLQNGSVAVSGSLAYAAQQAWLMNATIRDNITFGLDYNKLKYEVVIFACDLIEDFNILPSGDLTEVGERGINLSGGQKQRISLARALYSDREIYLLDDPLSAVDSHVGKHIFVEAILNQLKKRGKTVLLVTHQLQYLPHCDQVALITNGNLVESKSYEDLVKNTDVSVEDPADEGQLEHHQPPSSSDTSLSKISNVDATDELQLLSEGKLMTKEERGDIVSLSTYKMYVKASGGYFAVSFMFLFFAINIGMQQFSNFWLSFWLKQGSGGTTHGNHSFVNATSATTTDVDNILVNPKFHFYLLIYGTSAVIMFIVSVLRGYTFVCMTIRASHIMHKSLFKTVLHGSMAFFDTTPSGRIINRFQKDIDEEDVILPSIMEIFFFNFTTLLFAVGLIAFVFPKFLIAFAVIFPIFLITYFIFKPAAREMKRLDSLTRSPWFSHITTAVTGLDTIKTFQQSHNFIKVFRNLLDRNGVPCYLFACVNRWLAIRLDLLTISSCVITTILVILNQDIVSPAFAGLALSSAFLMSGLLQFTVRLLTEGEARFVCIDRIKYYIDNTPQETTEFSVTPQLGWPNLGTIEFRNVNMRYRDGLPLVLKDLSFRLNSKEKIGIVGRTGSGKSSLSVALFRLVEISSGSIWIDGIDICSISLQELRSKLSIIPQDPVLFTGSVRYNLDPFDQYLDSDIWSALEKAHLKICIANLPGQLQGSVRENGNNFSVGERQLMCLARALLRKSKILVLDEATAAVDNETEGIVHKIIDEMFSDCTLIMIAHRLSAVLSCDRVLVLDEGTLMEFNTPQNLLQNKSSSFSKMLSAFQSGIFVSSK